MSGDFDPYYKWLGIPREEQPPNHYRLLGITSFEGDPQVIDAAADRQMVYLRTFQTGAHVQQSQKLLNEVAGARLCLLNQAKKAEYDAALRKKAAGYQPPPPVQPPALRPVARAQRLDPEPAIPVSMAPEPMMLVNPTAAPLSVHRRRAAPLWRQSGALVMAAFAIVAVVAAGMWFSRDDQPPAVVTAPLSPPTVETPTSNPVVSPSPSGVESSSTTSNPATPITPISPPAGSGGVRIDLLKQIDLTRHVVKGSGSRTGSALSSDLDSWTIFQIPYRPGNREYALEIVAELVDKSGPLNVGLVYPGSGALVSLDVNGKTCLSNVDGNKVAAVDPVGPIARGNIFSPGAKPLIRIQVRQQGIDVFADGRLLLNWKDYSRLSPNQQWTGPDKESLAIGWNEGTFRIEKLDVIQLAGRFPASTSSPMPVSPPPSVAEENPLPAAAPPTITERRPVPPAEELQAAEKQVREIFRKEFENATRPDAKAELAKTLATQAQQTRDKPADHYALLKLSADLAAEAGDADQVQKLLGTLSDAYELDLSKVAAVVAELGKNARNDARTKAVEVALEYADAALAEEHFETATQLANLGMSIVSKLRETDLRKTVKDQQDQIKSLQKQSQAATAAAETLKENPDDPAANLIRGKYLCLVKQDWDAGLPLLAKSSQADLKAAAEKELAADKKPEDKSALGDAWMAVAKTAPADDRGGYESRAQFWFKDALDEVAGLAKAYVERRLNDLQASTSSKPTVASRTKKNLPPKPGMAGRVILDNGDAGLTVYYQPGMQLKDETLKALLSQHKVKWRPLQVEFGGYFTAPAAGTYFFHQTCYGPQGAFGRLFVDGVDVSTVGFGTDTFDNNGRTLAAGVHTLRWIVAGRDAIGQSDIRITYINPTTSTSDTIPVLHLPGNLAKLKTKAEADLSSN